MNTTKLKNVCVVVSGTTPKSTDERYWNGTHVWITPAELSEDSFIVTDSERHITDEAIKATGLKSFPKGTVLLSSRAPIGKVAIAGCEMYCNQGFKNLICSESIYNLYLYYFLKSKTAYLNSLGRGATFKEISKGIVEDISIPFPVYSEQIRIAKQLQKISELISLKKGQYRYFDDIIRSRFIEMFGNVGEIDKHKVHDAFVTKLGDVANVKSSHRVFTSEFVESGIPFYRGTEIGELSNGQIPKHPFYITREHYEKLANDDSRPKIGDLLLPSICNNGQIWLVDTNKPFYYKDGRVLCISPYPDVFNSIYLLYYLKYRLTYEYPKLGSGSTFAEFKIFQLKNMDVSVPNIMKQNLFANFIHQVDKSKMAVQKSLDELETLKKSLMQTYFG